MPQRKKRELKNLAPVQQRIVTSLETIDRSLRWLALKVDEAYPILWSKIWVNEKIDTETVMKISKVLETVDQQFNASYFFSEPSAPQPAVHFSMPGAVSEEQMKRIRELSSRLNEIAASPEDTELVIQLIDKILGKK